MRVSWHLFWKMLRRQRQIRMYMHQCVDAVLFALGLWLAHEVRSISTHLWPQFQLAQIESFSEYLWLWVAILPLAPLVLQAQGFYNRPILFSRRETAWVLGKSAAILTLATVSLLFLKKEELARSVIILFGAFGFGMVLLKEELVRRWAATELGQEQLRRRLVVIGEPDETGKVVDELAEKIGGGVEVLARLTFDEASPEKILEMLHDRSANGIILSAGHVYFDQVERIIETCELEGVEVWLLADFFRTKVSQTSVDDFLGRPTLVFRSTPEASWQGVIKQVIDFLGAALALVVLFIPMILVGILIRYSSPGPVFFLQKRSGLNGRPFTMLKFRTMVSNAEQRKAELEAFNEMDGPVFKVASDPRITSVGRWLRKFSVDEWPQLWNVVRGEMSLVGPRPLPVDEIKRINDSSHRRRLSVKPGLTCLWQISGRNDVKSFKEWVRLDLEYIDNWSLWLDLKILIKTIPVVFFGTGAR